MAQTYIGVTLLTLALAAAAGAEPVGLVADGQPAATIVIADKPSDAARQAADDLRMWLQKATGAELPLVREADAPGDGAIVLVGDTAKGRALGLDPAAFELEELRIATFPGVLALVGDDARPDGLPLRGTLLAVHEFADRVLGVRLLWPGPLGEVVPPRASVEVEGLDVRIVPGLRQRNMRNSNINSRSLEQVKRLGWPEDTLQRRQPEAELWWRFHRQGSSYRGNYGHAYGDYWKRFSETHPEWFALQPDGTRDHSRAEGGRRARLCVSNEALIATIAQEKIEQLRAEPMLDCVSVSPNDGGGTGFCVCEACEALDPPNAPRIMVRVPGSTDEVEHASYSDRFLHFYNAIAEQVAAAEPERLIGAYAYSAYKLPPVRERVHPNVVLGFVDGGYLNEEHRQRARENWVAWSDAGAQHLFWRPNALMAGLGYPSGYAHRLADDVRYFMDRGMFATDFDCNYHLWATDGLNYYVLARVLWDLDADVDAIIDEYCQAGFGPAAGAMRSYYDTLEAMTTELANSGAYEDRKKDGAVLVEFYGKALPVLTALLDAADRAAGGDATVRERIGFVRLGLEYTGLRLACDRARLAGDVAARKAADEAREAFYQRIGPSWAVNAAHLKFYGY